MTMTILGRLGGNTANGLPGAPIYPVGQWSPGISAQAVKDGGGSQFYSLQDPDGIVYGYRGSNGAYAICEAPTGWTRFELRPGDYNLSDASEKTSGHERVEIATRDDIWIKVGQPFTLNFDFIREAGPKNTAAWCLIGQLHQDLGTSKLPGSPPFAIELVGERLLVRTRSGPDGQDGAKGRVNTVRYLDTADITPGKSTRLTITGMIHPKFGFMTILRDGVKVGGFVGQPWGYDTLAGVYLARGIYRMAAPETIAVHSRISYRSISPLIMPLV